MGSEYWFDASALEGASRSVLGRLRSTGGDDRRASSARANGLVLDEEPVGDLPSLVLAGERRSSDIVRFVGDPVVEFANHGSRGDPVTDDFVPPRMGYIAVRHGLAVPHVVASFRGVLGAKTAANVATATFSVLGRFNANANAFRVSRLGRFIDEGARTTTSRRARGTSRSGTGWRCRRCW